MQPVGHGRFVETQGCVRGPMSVRERHTGVLYIYIYVYIRQESSSLGAALRSKREEEM